MADKVVKLPTVDECFAKYPYDNNANNVMVAPWGPNPSPIPTKLHDDVDYWQCNAVLQYNNFLTVLEYGDVSINEGRLESQRDLLAGTSLILAFILVFVLAKTVKWRWPWS